MSAGPLARVLLVTALWAPAVVAAQPPEAGPPEAESPEAESPEAESPEAESPEASPVSLGEARARAMFERAIAELEAGHAAAGRDLLQRSLSILPTTAARFNLAIALRETGELTEARVQLDILARDPSVSPAIRARVEELRAELDASIATLRIRAAEPGSAPTEVEVDGVAVGELEGESSLRVSVDPGEHRVAGLRETWRGVERVTVQRGELRDVVLELSPFTEPSTEVEAWPFLVAGGVVAAVGAALAIILVVVLGEPAHPEAVTVRALVEF